MQTGASPGGDSSEAEPEQPHPAAGGGEEWSPGAAGGGGGGQEESGETSAGPAVPGARAPPEAASAWMALRRCVVSAALGRVNWVELN